MKKSFNNNGPKTVDEFLAMGGVIKPLAGYERKPRPEYKPKFNKPQKEKYFDYDQNVLVREWCKLDKFRPLLLADNMGWRVLRVQKIIAGKLYVNDKTMYRILAAIQEAELFEQGKIS